MPIPLESSALCGPPSTRARTSRPARTGSPGGSTTGRSRRRSGRSARTDGSRSRSSWTSSCRRPSGTRGPRPGWAARCRPPSASRASRSRAAAGCPCRSWMLAGQRRRRSPRRGEAGGREVVREGIEPDVGDVVGVPGQRDPPVEVRPADREVRSSPDGTAPRSAGSRAPRPTASARSAPGGGPRRPRAGRSSSAPSSARPALVDRAELPSRRSPST